MDLSDALGGGNSSNPSWPDPAQAQPTWPGGGNGSGWPSSGGGGGAWPSSGVGGGAWPPSGGGGGAWPSSGGGGGASGGGGGAWPPSGGGKGASGGGGGAWPSSGGGGGASGGGGGGWPSSGGGGPPPALPVVHPSKPLAVPYSHPFPGGFHDKLLITIRGTVKPNPNKFTVDLHTDHDLVFHFNPRFNENGRKVIVRNSLIGKKWGQEERQLSNFPFAPETPFEMKILCTQKEFKVAVNNSHLLEFKHRMTNLRLITKLCIHNDIILQGFNVENLP